MMYPLYWNSLDRPHVLLIRQVPSACAFVEHLVHIVETYQAEGLCVKKRKEKGGAAASTGALGQTGYAAFDSEAPPS